MFKVNIRQTLQYVVVKRSVKFVEWNFQSINHWNNKFENFYQITLFCVNFVILLIDFVKFT